MNSLKKYDQFWKSEYEELAKYTDNAGIDFMSTPFDSESVNFLSDLMPAFKIASADITNLPLLKQVAGKNKPILLSTGASTLAEVEGAIAIIQKQSPAIDITLLHCVLNYPTQLENANIGMIRHMVSVFDKFRIGYSDHTLPEHMNTVLASAWLSGAEVIEKHFTHDKSLPGNDHYHAMDKVDLKHFHDHLNHLQLLMGASQKHYLPSEEISRRNARRSIVAKRDIAAGQTITEDDLIAKRPGTGISPTEWYKVIGTTAKTTIQEDDIIQMSQLVNVKS
jgi:sialic acid synthase SpsE